MSKKQKESAEQHVKAIRRATRKQYSAGQADLEDVNGKRQQQGWRYPALFRVPRVS